MCCSNQRVIGQVVVQDKYLDSLWVTEVGRCDHPPKDGHKQTMSTVLFLFTEIVVLNRDCFYHGNCCIEQKTSDLQTPVPHPSKRKKTPGRGTEDLST